jgi:membrane-bound ClpP family serine protease
VSPYLLWVAGLILIFLEFYLPGAVMGIAGALLLVSSLFLFAISISSTLFAIYVVLMALSVAGVIKFALWAIPRSKSFYAREDQEGFQASRFDASLIGKTGMVLSDLKPGGYIQVEGKQHQALSESGYLAKGTEVKVIRGEGESLIVRKKE